MMRTMMVAMQITESSKRTGWDAVMCIRLHSRRRKCNCYFIGVIVTLWSGWQQQQQQQNSCQQHPISSLCIEKSASSSMSS
mmetsp:Transcript_44635/g.74481  ORF Transcript_44635/g.74481 Transcript_44635/m.74481 type:complete len:81 (+) Transcript_44635:719-961(+)